MRFEFEDASQVIQTIDAGAQVFAPVRMPRTYYATADMGDAYEITHLGEKTELQILIPYFTEVELQLFESLCDALAENRTVTVSIPDGDIVLMQNKFPFVARRKRDSIPFPQHINTSCNNKFRLTLDLIITG